MSILNIRPAVRAGSKLVIGIAGQSGSGKTLTALYMARGMVDNASEIGFLDTENRRGSLYADELDGPFMIGDLFYPFTPDRYAEAVKEFQAAGTKVLIVDSISHEWESGCMEIAEKPLVTLNQYGKYGKMADWKKAKSEHKKMMTVLLQSDMHIICCIRAAEKMDFTSPSKPVSLGVQPLCEKNFMFEMTASIMMFNEGMNQQHLKVPKDLKGVFGDGNGYLGQEVGKAILDWVNSGECDPEMDSYRNKMQLASNGGCDELKAAWIAMPKAMQAKMAKLKAPLWASAQAVDELNKEESADQPEQSAPKVGFNPAQTVEKKEPEVIVEKVAVTDEQIQDKF